MTATVPHVAASVDWSGRAKLRALQVGDRDLQPHADQLRVTVRTLRDFGCWIHDGCLAAPMRDGAGAVLGVRLRRINGSKARRYLSLPGGSDGLFCALRPNGGRLIVTEGLTDALAAHHLGLAGPGVGDVVGKPSNRGADDILRVLAQGRDVVVIPDTDGPGLDGGCETVDLLLDVAQRVRIVLLPDGTKDIRAYIASGANLVDLEEAIAAAAVVTA